METVNPTPRTGLESRLREVLPDSYQNIRFFRRGGTRLLYLADWGPGKEKRVIKVDTEPDNPRAQLHVNRGYDTEHEIMMLSHEDHEEHGISALVDYYQNPELNLSVERFFESESLEERVAKEPLSTDEFEKVFSHILSSVAYLISERGIYHRDLKPSNILLGKGKQKNKTRITDLANAGEIKDVEAKVRPTGSGRFVMDPLLLSQFTGDINSYNEQAEIYALGIDMYYALTGKYLFEFDPDLGTARVVETGENLLNPEGKLISDRYHNSLGKALRELPKEKRKFASILEKCLILDPAKRYTETKSQTFPDEKFSAISYLESDFKKAIKPSIWGRLINSPLAMGLLVLGGLIVGGQQLGYHALNNENKELEARVEEASKQLRVGSEWSTMDVEIGNNLFALDVRVNRYWKEGTEFKSESYPLQKYISVAPGEKLDIYINLNEFGKPKTGNNVLPCPLKVGFYLEGFEKKEIRLNTLNYDKSAVLEPESGWSYFNNYQRLEIPADLPSGNYQLAVEVYAPKPEDIPKQPENVHIEKSDLVFEKPGNILARKTVPIAVRPTAKANDPSKVSNPPWNVDYLQLSYQDYISISDINYPLEDVNKNVIVDVSVPEENYHLSHNPLEDKFPSANTIGVGFYLPDGTDTDLKTLELVYHKDGKLLGYQYFPVHRRDLGKDGTGPFWWELAVPDERWSENLIKYREKLFEKYSLK